ncbi:MAG: dihydroneopterin aldolase [Paludibacteraceae bacterium]|nr:dihydroneopterin aldolase [Paludibacteraceae bacterium]
MLIRLEDISFTAYHGVFAEERQQGNTFLVSVSLDIPEVPAVKTDRLEDTVDYGQVYQIVRKEMERPSQLIEHVAGRIRSSLQQAWPEAMVHIQIKKKHPPVGGEVAWATIEL